MDMYLLDISNYLTNGGNEKHICLLFAAVDFPVEVAEVIRPSGRAKYEAIRALGSGYGTILTTNITIALVRIFPGVQGNRRTVVGRRRRSYIQAGRWTAIA